ncbi:MAG: acyl-CoA/acyl-ACP dehydrogenase [Deltaproteobacteria bacterium]|nr:acyl-CoA/acyl-ACP dehydrogenase [Deltaproteobacteria bacterium]
MTQPKDFGFGSNEQMLQQQARKFLDEHCSIEKLRQIIGDRTAYERDGWRRFDENTWKKISELGWPALAIPEEAGGPGLGMVAVAALVEEAGAHALPAPLLSTLLSTFVLRECKTPEAYAWMGRIAEGEAATLAITNSDGSWEPGDAPLEAKSSGGGGFTLNGTAAYVLDAPKADFLVVSAHSPQGIALFAIPVREAGIKIKADRIVDLTREQGTINFSNVRVPGNAVVAGPGKGLAVLQRALPSIWTAVAADSAGAAEWQLKTTVEYAKVREQFGRPIGFFQAVKHPIVNMMCEIDQVRSLVYNAACAIDHEPENAEKYARMAKAAAAECGWFCSGRSVQFHGGIGFTWECDVHIYFKRQQMNQFLFGDGRHHRRHLADILIGPSTVVPKGIPAGRISSRPAKKPAKKVTARKPVKAKKATTKRPSPKKKR